MEFSQSQLENIMFVDIETVSVVPEFDELPERFQGLWNKKARILNKREEEPVEPGQLFKDRAAIFAEFGKVVCISAGYIKFVNGITPTFRAKSYFGSDEHQVLTDFGKVLDQFMSRPERNLCAHNGKEFDFPYLGRRYLINGIPLPKAISDIQMKKPWEVRLLDTMTMWKFGDFKNFSSLDLLCACLGVPSPKDDIDGSEVGRVFWEEDDAKRIALYCEKDVLATAQVLLRFARYPLIKEEDFHSMTP